MKHGRLLALVLLLLSAKSYAHGPGPEYVPLLRLIDNLSAAIQKKPKEAENYYLLGRVHYFAFTAPRERGAETGRPADTVGVYDRNGAITFNTWFGSDKPGKSKAPGPVSYVRTSEAQLAHVRAAVVNLNRALTMRGEEAAKKGGPGYAARAGLYELCLACALEDGAPFAPKVGAFSGLDASSKSWLAAAAQNYWLAFSRAEASDLKNPPALQRTLVSEEAGASYKRLVTARGSVTATEKARLSRISATLATLAKRPRAVTPIVFSLTPGESAATVVQRNRAMRFDLDGTGVRALDSWPAPETAILVWDPARTGKVTSGVQLFGSSTFWLFWKDGYAAMAALDDNGDGWLAGRELKGLALWQDRNSNGRSDPGEVTPVEAAGVDALAVTATSTEAGFASNPQGVRLRSGILLPTWDWVAMAGPQGGRAARLSRSAGASRARE